MKNFNLIINNLTHVESDLIFEFSLTQSCLYINQKLGIVFFV